MQNANAKSIQRKAKLMHELTALWWAFLYLFILFGMLRLYGDVLLEKNSIADIKYGTAAINALIFAKVILIGDWMRLGERGGERTLLASVLIKSVVFAGFFIVFHFIEELVVGLWHDKSLHEILSFDATHFRAAMVASVIFAVALLPYFAFREMTFAIGWQRMQTLLTVRNGVEKIFGKPPG
jgi:hypothetical protein